MFECYSGNLLNIVGFKPTHTFDEIPITFVKEWMQNARNTAS